MQKKITDKWTSTFLSRNGPRLLNIGCSSTTKEEFVDISKMCDTLKMDANKKAKKIMLIVDSKILLQTQSNNSLLETEINFKHLANQSQLNISEKSVSLQGIHIKFNY